MKNQKNRSMKVHSQSGRNYKATYSLDSSKRLSKELAGVKKILMAHKQSMRLLDGYPIEKEIIGVMKKIANLKEKDLLDPSLDPQDIRKKLPPDRNLALYKTVKNYVDTYYVIRSHSSDCPYTFQIARA